MEEIQVTEKNDWVVTVTDDLQRMCLDTVPTEEKQRWDKHSIYKVPASVRVQNENAYKPQFVSFGPYHHGEDRLKPMEEHKQRALLHFLKRSNQSLHSCINSLTGIAQRLKDSYESLDFSWERDTDRFLQMMILDGCFMIEVLRNFAELEPMKDYADNDPIFSKHGKLHNVPYIRRDMLLLENQLPMLLLIRLLDHNDQETKQSEEYVNTLIVKFLCFNIHSPCHPSVGKCLHLLEVQRKILLWKGTSKTKTRCTCFRHQQDENQKDSPRPVDGMIIRSAMEIDEAGVSFKRSQSQSLDDISFQGGELRLPFILVDDHTQSMFLNLIAFERLHAGVGNEVTSYICFMDGIIDSAKDVTLLHESGIIENAIGSDEAAAQLFDSAAKDATLDTESNLDKVHKTVVKYCKQRCNKWRAYWYHNYCRNPWTIITVIAAVVLFVLTMLQTVYTMLSYHAPSS